MSRVGEALRRKLGPLPAGAWLGLFALVMVIWRSFARKPQPAPAGPSAVQQAPSQGPLVAIVPMPPSQPATTPPVPETDPVFLRWLQIVRARRPGIPPAPAPTDTNPPPSGTLPPVRQTGAVVRNPLTDGVM
jgi:hypothetical protein